MAEVIFYVGAVVVCGCFSLMLKSKNEKMLAMQLRMGKLENENHNFWTDNLKNKKEIKYLHKTILFDNDLLIQKTEINEKDKEKIAELNEDYNFSRDIAISRWEEIRYLRRKIKTIRADRLKKVIKAEKLGGVE